MNISLIVTFILPFVAMTAAADSQCPATFDQARHGATDAYKRDLLYQGSFADYVASTRSLVKKHNPRAMDTLHGSITVLDGVSPFELRPSASCSTASARKGVLLIHGLTDTPYLLRELGEHFAQKCFLVRSILLPGHGTVPGDLTDVEYRAWVEATDYGVQELAADVDQIYMLGFSTGGTLALHYAFGKRTANSPSTFRNKLKGLILLAPAIEVKSRFAWAADEKIWFNRHLLDREVWRPVAPDDDLVKYESFNVNAGAQIYKLTKELMDVKGSRLDIPFMIALSDADETVESQTTMEFFDARAPEKSRMLLYTNTPPFHWSCPGAGICRVKSERITAEVRILDFAHTSLPLSQSDAYYGRHGRYFSCVHYLDANNCEAFRKCKDGDNHDVYYGERSTDNLKKGIVRRLTWNPDFQNMVTEMDKFVAATLSR
jgi:esterase/lipase